MALPRSLGGARYEELQGWLILSALLLMVKFLYLFIYIYIYIWYDGLCLPILKLGRPVNKFTPFLTLREELGSTNFSLPQYL